MSEPWRRGPVEGIIPELQPVAHALQLARENLEKILPGLSCAQVWQQPGAAAAIGWHVRHSMGSLRRMLLYPRGESLNDDEVKMLEAERGPIPELDGGMLLDLAVMHIESAMQQLRTTTPAELDVPRAVGRKKLPSNVRGLLYHAGEHTARHVGQIATTAKVVV